MEKTGGRKGLLYLASAAARFMAPYVPADNLVLQQRVNITTEKDRGQIHYLSPYAHYQWEGVLYVDPKAEKGAFTNGEGLFWSRPGVAKNQQAGNWNTARSAILWQPPIGKKP